MERKPNRLKLNPSLESLSDAAIFLEQQLERSDVPMKVSAQINIALDEVFSNINLYSSASKVTMEVDVWDRKITLRFFDNGQPYDPTKQADPDVTTPLMEREPGGLGIFMVKNIMDSIDYEYENGQNILTLAKSY